MIEEVHRIIEEMFLAGDFKRLMNSFRFSSDGPSDAELRRDFEQELILILAEYSRPERIVGMHRRNKNELMRFLIRIIKNNLCSETSPYWKKYGKWEYNRQNFEPKEHEIDEAEFREIELEYTREKGIFSEDTRVLSVLKELPEADRRIIILYAELSSVRKVAGIFNCSSSVIFYRIKRIRDYFKRRLCPET